MPDLELNEAIACHQAGRLSKAKRKYETVLERTPDHSDALHLLGVTHHQLGDHLQALEYVAAAIRLKPENCVFFSNLGLVLAELGRHNEAVKAIQRSIELNPAVSASHYNLGNVFQQIGDLKRASDSFQRSLSLDPNFTGARLNLGNLYQQEGKLELAIECFQENSRRNAADTASRFNLANALKQQGKLAQAVEALMEVLQINPQHVDALNNLGNIWHDEGHAKDAAELYKRAIHIAPTRADLYNNLGNALKALGSLQQAAVACAKAIELDPSFAQAHNNLGNIFKDQARMGDALACYATAHKINPQLPDVLSNLLLTAQYTNHYNSSQLFSLHEQYGQTFETPLKAIWPKHARAPTDLNPTKRLRVGYVSADFCNHPVASFIAPVIEHHNRKEVEVFCYYNHVKQDSITSNIQRLADQWVACHGMNDGQLAARIVADGIDILVDLAGHSAAGRLLAFARKPAPIQVTYLGYIATTGLTAIDYRLTQSDTDPPGNESFYTEQLYRLPGDLWWVYRPSKAAPEPGPLPALANGYITFGSTNNVGKLSPQVISTWSEILRRNAAAKLLIAGLADDVGRHRLCEQFSAHGIAIDRLLLCGRLPVNKYYELHQKIDIALDPFPYNGGTTTCDSLWMGLPPIALKGDAFVSRMGWGLLKCLGLPELVAESVDEYVNIACAMAGDIEKLSALRAGLRNRVAASPLCDEVGFTRKLESAYRAMWQTWSAAQAPQTNNKELTGAKQSNTIPMKKFLHVGCGPQTKARTTRAFNTPEWTELRLDIDPSVKPDIVGTMLDMSAVPDASVDAIFSSHNIEHLYPHEVPLALAEFKRVLKPDGYAVITCPDLKSICALVAEDKLTQTAYTSPSGPITPLDMLYGHRPPMAKGNLYMSHRCGFTEKVLSGTLRASGFQAVASIQRAARFDLWAVASVSAMDEGQLRAIAESHIPQ